MKKSLWEETRQSQMKCPPGCKRFSGGEVRHHQDCQHYPGSMSEQLDNLEFAQKRPANQSAGLRKQSRDQAEKVQHGKAKAAKNEKYANISATLTVRGAKDATQAWQYCRDNYPDFDDSVNVTKVVSGGQTAYRFERKDLNERGMGK